MSESKLSWMKPCAHAEPQGASQLHGVCIFCYRDRLSAAHATVGELVAALREARVWIYEGTDDAQMIDLILANQSLVK